MGCWNQTCGLTQLHIRAGEKVMVVPIVADTQDNLCYTTPFWSPFHVPFYSEYNDYGGGENSSGFGLNMVLEAIKSRLVEMEQGENQYHDIPVKKDALNEDLFWEAIHEQRLYVKSTWGETQTQVSMVMIKQSIFDHLAENYQFSDFVNDGDGYKYVYYKLADIRAGIPAIVEAFFGEGDRLRKLCGEDASEEEVKSFHSMLMRYEALSRICRMFNDGDEQDYQKRMKAGNPDYNYAAAWLRHGAPSYMRYNSFGHNGIDEMLADLSDAGDKEGAIALLNEFVNILFVDAVMLHTRKFWSPQAGAGSQQQEPEGYRAIMAAMSHVLDEEEAEQRAWDEEDEEEDEGEE